jgi:hypothetical protein
MTGSTRLCDWIRWGSLVLAGIAGGLPSDLQEPINLSREVCPNGDTRPRGVHCEGRQLAGGRLTWSVPCGLERRDTGRRLKELLLIQSSRAVLIQGVNHQFDAVGDAQLVEDAKNIVLDCVGTEV